MKLPGFLSPRVALAVAGVGVAVAGWWHYFGTGLGSPSNERKFTGTVMGSAYSLILAGDLPVDPAVAHQAAYRELARVDALMSTYREDSDLGRLNRAAPGAWVDVAPETARVLREAREVGMRSGGAYDITLGPLVNLWGFGPEHRPATSPTDAEIEEVRRSVGWQHLEIRPEPPAARRLIEGAYVDLSSIATGFAVDQAAQALEHLGVRNYCVEVSGELRASGSNGRGLPWRIAVESPAEGETAAKRIVPVSGLAVTTSGDYRNYFEEAGVRYSHIIDPRTGHPITHRLASVTVVDPSCMRADVWDTALMAAGPEAGFALAEKENLAAYFLIRTRDGFLERETRAFRVLVTNRQP